jgi:Fic family protein
MGEIVHRLFHQLWFLGDRGFFNHHLSLLSKELKMTQPTARSALNHLKSLGVLEEVSGKKRETKFISIVGI